MPNILTLELCTVIQMFQSYYNTVVQQYYFNSTAVTAPKGHMNGHMYAAQRRRVKVRSNYPSA